MGGTASDQGDFMGKIKKSKQEAELGNGELVSVTVGGTWQGLQGAAAAP